MEKAILGGGCYWCLDALYVRVQGVYKVTSGFSGGDIENPTYRMMHTQDTGHAEVVQIEFDPKEVSYATLLDIFWYMHNPTTLNRQGADIGTEYRSIILYTSDEQQKIAEDSKANVATTIWDNPIVTEIAPFTTFYPADETHQDYYGQNGQNQYCQVVINPKLAKFTEKFGDILK